MYRTGHVRASFFSFLQGVATLAQGFFVFHTGNTFVAAYSLLRSEAVAHSAPYSNKHHTVPQSSKTLRIGEI